MTVFELVCILPLLSFSPPWPPQTQGSSIICVTSVSPALKSCSVVCLCSCKMRTVARHHHCCGLPSFFLSFIQVVALAKLFCGTYVDAYPAQASSVNGCAAEARSPKPHTPRDSVYTARARHCSPPFFCAKSAGRHLLGSTKNSRGSCFHTA